MKTQERGSITLFVLIVMLFFITVLILTYADRTNKINNQKQQIGEIERQYNAGDFDKEYIKQEEKMPIKIILYKPNGIVYNTNEWTNEDLTLKIFYPEAILEDYRYYYLDEIETKYIEGQKITKNCKISVRQKDKEEVVVVSRIDKTKPTVALTPNGGEYTKRNHTNFDITTKVVATDLGGSGLATLEYAWSTSNTVQPTSWNAFTNGSSIVRNSSVGKYYLWTNVKDKAGNNAVTVKVSNPFVVGGWQQSNNLWYYYSPQTAAKLLGWQKLKHSDNEANLYWYYLDPNNEGAMTMGWKSINNYWYYFLSDTYMEGIMKTGWAQVDGSWYFFRQSTNQYGTGPEGSMLANTSAYIGNKTYYFNSSGVCTNP